MSVWPKTIMVDPGYYEYRFNSNEQWLNEAKDLNDPKSESGMLRNPNQRCITNIPIVCSHLSSFCSAEPIEGVILDTCQDGFYAELKAHLNAGTVIVVRTIGSFLENPMDIGVCSHALAKVRWSKPILVDKEKCYATGLQYVMDY